MRQLETLKNILENDRKIIILLRNPVESLSRYIIMLVEQN